MVPEPDTSTTRRAGRPAGGGGKASEEAAATGCGSPYVRGARPLVHPPGGGATTDRRRVGGAGSGNPWELPTVTTITAG
ncbi:hypothetical protein GCM10009738_30610 [Kitasatospora viridis]